MRHDLAYLGAPSRVRDAKTVLEKMTGWKGSTAEDSWGGELPHPTLAGVRFRVSLLGSIDDVVHHLRHYPLNLLIIDERDSSRSAVDWVSAIGCEARSLADRLGPDFNFPKSRIVAILSDGHQSATRTFLLGREQVRGVLVDPHSFSKIMRWIVRVVEEEVGSRGQKIGVACTGGGVEGYLFQLGASLALQQALGSEKNLCDAQIYSGLSSGAVLATALACRLDLAELARSVFGTSKILPHLRSSTLYDPALQDIMRRLLREALSWGEGGGRDGRALGLTDRLSRSVPNGFFGGRKLMQYLETALAAFGVEDWLPAARRPLLIGATDQDSFEHVLLGSAPQRDVRITHALRASAALPPFFDPFVIDGRYYIDGMISRSSHIAELIRRKCDLIVVIDPMKPQPSGHPGASHGAGGLFTIIQTVKALVQTRFIGELNQVTERYGNVDFWVVQPTGELAQAMAGSPMKLRIRTELLEMAYRETLVQLGERYSALGEKLEKYGFSLADPARLQELRQGPFLI